MKANKSDRLSSGRNFTLRTSVLLQPRLLNRMMFKDDELRTFERNG